MYDTQADNKLYLAGSKMLYKSRPVLILEAFSITDYAKMEKVQMLSVKYLSPKAVPFSIRADSKFLEREPVKLGYINTNDGAVYLKRTTAKYYKKGITEANVRNAHSMDDSALLRVHQGAYPTLDSVASTIDLGISNSVAFHRDWAIRDSYLLYKDKTVGRYKNRKCELYNKFKFLTTRLKEATHG